MKTRHPWNDGEHTFGVWDALKAAFPRRRLLGLSWIMDGEARPVWEATWATLH